MYIISIIFFVILAVLSPFSGSVGLIYGIIFTLFLPGFIVVNLFLKEFGSIEKLVLTIFLSVVLSTQLVYWISMVIGYSKFSIVAAGLLLTPAIFFIRLENKDFRRVNFTLLRHPAILLSLGTFIIFYVVLSGSVFVFQENNILLSGSNYQDTPMHLEIIESLNQGNFPPQMPYYSGVRMTYHYFVDLHTAIIEKIADMSNPRIVVYLNSLLASIFALTIYMIANYVTKSRKSAIFAGIIGTFGGGFSYVMFYDALSRYDWNKFSDLLLQNYVLEWEKFFQIVPTFEVLLQSRPQLIGLPGLALSLYFLYRGLIEKDIKKMILAGAITGLLFPFQVTAFLSVILISTLLIFYSLFQDNFKFWFKGYLSFIIPVILSIPFIMAIDPTTTSHLSFQIGWWAPDKRPLGLVIFYVGNLGIPFVMSFFFPLVQRRHEFFIYSWLLAMFILPNIATFTPDSFDMYKFFHFMWIPVAITTGCILRRLWDKKLYIIVAVLLIFSVLTPFLDAMWNLSVKYPGYSIDEYRAGIWVRGNTPQGSVFLEDASIHSPPTQIGGRLRIMGYKTWSTGQGYDILNRSSDIENAFDGTREELSEIIVKYNVSYAYIGHDETRNRPNVKKMFDKYFRSVYSNDQAGIWIYKLNANVTVRKV
jgi:hypothetical protein